MKDLSHLMNYITIYDKYARQNGENTTSLIVLMLLYYNRKEGIKQHEICSKCFFTKQVVNAVIKKFCERDFIDSHICCDDNRTKVLVLSPIGLEYAKKIIKPLEKIQNKIFKEVDKDEKEKMINLIEQYSLELKSLIIEE